MNRFLILLLLAPLAASAAPGDSDLDWLSGTDGIVGPSVSPGSLSSDPDGRASRLAADPVVPADNPAVPIDGGLSLLALAGAGYAARRLRRRAQA